MNAVVHDGIDLKKSRHSGPHYEVAAAVEWLYLP
jgi:hypothetical protein